MNRILLALSLLALAAGCSSDSICSEAFDTQVDECGAQEADRELSVGICENLDQDQVARCLECTVDAADPCTANDPGGACEDICSFEL